MTLLKIETLSWYQLSVLKERKLRDSESEPRSKHMPTLPLSLSLKRHESSIKPTSWLHFGCTFPVFHETKSYLPTGKSNRPKYLYFFRKLSRALNSFFWSEKTPLKNSCLSTFFAREPVDSHTKPVRFVAIRQDTFCCVPTCGRTEIFYSTC